MVRLHFSESGVEPISVNTEHYIARYIIGKKETFARIHFAKADQLESLLADYGRLHEANCHIFSSMCDAFYSGVFTDWQRTRVLLDEFREAVAGTLEWTVNSHLNVKANFARLWFGELKDPNAPLSIALADADERMLAFLNADKDVRAVTSLHLRKIYRFVGEFIFEEAGVPF
jgi:hypothetical protein